MGWVNMVELKWRCQFFFFSGMSSQANLDGQWVWLATEVQGRCQFLFFSLEVRMWLAMTPSEYEILSG